MSGGARRIVKLAAATALSVGVAACSLVVEWGSFGPKAEGRDDAKSDGPSATGDGKAPPGSDRESGADTSARFCSTVNAAEAICVDFDDDAGSFAPFSFVNQGVSGVTDSAKSNSAPNSFVFTTPTSGAVGGALECATSGRPFAIDLDVLVESFGNADFDIVMVDSDTTYEVGLEIESNGLLSWDYEPEPVGSTDLALTSGWNHLRWTVALNGADLVMTLELNGQTSASPPPTVPASVLTGSRMMIVGDRRLEGTSKVWKVRVDNIVMRPF
jgi:hypothetical protein